MSSIELQMRSYHLRRHAIWAWSVHFFFWLLNKTTLRAFINRTKTKRCQEISLLTCRYAKSRQGCRSPMASVFSNLRKTRSDSDRANYVAYNLTSESKLWVPTASRLPLRHIVSPLSILFTGCSKLQTFKPLLGALKPSVSLENNSGTTILNKNALRYRKSNIVQEIMPEEHRYRRFMCPGDRKILEHVSSSIALAGKLKDSVLALARSP